MSTAPQGWQNPKTNWQAADIVHPSDLNRIEGNIQAIESGSRTLIPSQVPTGNSGSLQQILSWFANRIRAITGATNWYDAPATTLAAAKSHIDATSGIHGATSSATANRLIIRDGSGRAQVAAPLSASDIATKGYVDSLVGTLQAGTGYTYFVTPDGVEFLLSLRDDPIAAVYRNWVDSLTARDWRSNVSVRVLLGGTIRCSAQHRFNASGSDSGSAYLRVLKNGAVIQEWSITSNSYVTRTVDVPVNPGDIITFQQRINVITDVNQSHQAYWHNLRILTTQPPLGLQLI